MSGAGKSFLDRFRPRSEEVAPPNPVSESPAPAAVALEPIQNKSLDAPKKPKSKPLSWLRLAKLVSRETNGFEDVVVMAVAIVNDKDAEAKDRIKAAEFLSKWTEANPATVRHTISGPDGKPVAVQHAHAHVVKIALPDLSHLSAAELDDYEKLAAKAAGELPAKGETDVIDVEVETKPE